MQVAPHCFANEESRKNLKVVGSNKEFKNNYTKADFMPPAKVAQKFKISTVKAKKLMKQLFWRDAKFVLNNHMASIIVQFDTYCLHPMAIEAFQQYIDKQKG